MENNITTRKQVIEATKKSIDHWMKDVLEPLQKKEEIEHSIITSEYCELCKLFEWNSGCQDCALYKNGYGCCDYTKSTPWYLFNYNPTRHNATIMIYALKDTLAWLEQGGGNYA